MIQNTIKRAGRLRRKKQGQEALALLLELHEKHPLHPLVNYHIAWTYDFMGKERKAVFYYETALKHGLKGNDRKGALLGLGSTFRCLGEYNKAQRVFVQAIKQFPNDRSFKVFQALVFYNLKQPKKAIELLLQQLLETTNSRGLRSYKRALTFYSNKLDKNWP